LAIPPSGDREDEFRVESACMAARRSMARTVTSSSGSMCIVERAFGIGPSALTEAVALLGQHLERRAA
jgi:transposase, IS6 family